MKLVIIDYGAGNIQSIRFAFERLGTNALLSSDPGQIAAADKVIFPGVGEASSAMRKLKASGLDRLIPRLEQPVLGICLGMQLMCRYSEEGNTVGLGIFDAEVVKFPPGQKIPQIGWNTIRSLRSPLFHGVEEEAYIYLVHSYYAPLNAASTATTDYGLAYSAGLQRDNFFGLQFHPEKSSGTGEKILENFLKL